MPVPRVGTRVLVVDDRAESRQSTRLLLGRAGCVVDDAEGLSQALARLRVKSFDVVLTDVRMEHDLDGIELLRVVKADWPSVAVVVYTAWADSDTAVRARRLGAEDYLELPLPAEVFIEAVGRATIEGAKASSPGHRIGGEQIVAASAAMRGVLQLAGRLAATDAPVLIVGETGTGKELIARAIHRASRRGVHAMIAVNCGAIPAGFLESELFGHHRGAFTSAVDERRGLAEEAHHGTLFLDEVGELPVERQAALLRFLESGELRRLGENTLRRVDVRIVSATNRPLDTDAAGSSFRSDLYYRLSTAICRIPPLRERPEDIEPLVAQWCRKRADDRISVTPAAIGRLIVYSWPGNVRELRSILERAALYAAGPIIGPTEIDAALDGAAETAAAAVPTPLADERMRIKDALAKNHWHMGRTAASLGISRWTLRRRLRDTGLPD